MRWKPVGRSLICIVILCLYNADHLRCMQHLVTDVKSSPLARVDPLKYMVCLCLSVCVSVWIDAIGH